MRERKAMVACSVRENSGKKLNDQKEISMKKLLNLIVIPAAGGISKDQHNPSIKGSLI